MKIIISKNESYDLVLPEQITITEISSIIDRLHKLNKVFGNDPVMNAVKGSVARKKIDLTREDFIKLLNIYYSDAPIKERKEKFAEMKMDYHYFSGRSWGLRKKFDVKPKELGMKEFPTGRGNNSK